MAYFNKSPLLPTALLSEPNPIGSQDGSFNLLSNQSREPADLALLGWAGERPASWPGGLGPREAAATYNLQFQKPLHRYLERAAGRCEKQKQGWGRRLGDLILNRFRLKKENGYTTLCKTLTLCGALWGNLNLPTMLSHMEPTPRVLSIIGSQTEKCHHSLLLAGVFK